MLGPALLQPERIRRTIGRPSDESLIEDVVGLASRVIADKMNDGTIIDDLVATFEALADRLLDAAGGGLTRAVQNLEAVVAPLASLPDVIKDLVPDDEDPLKTATAAVDLLAKLGDFIGGLSIDTVREKTGTVLDVVQQDLGLTAEALEGHLWWLVDDLVNRLQTAPDGQDDDMVANRRAVASILRRFERRMRDEFKFPDLKAHELADALFEVIKGTGATQTLGRVSCAAKAAREGALVAKDLLALVPPTVPRSPRAGDDKQYLWYPTWLMNDLDSLWHDSLWPRGWLTPPGPVWLNNGKTMYRDKELFPGPMQWEAIRDPSGRNTTPRKYTFRKIPADEMETWARTLFFLTDYVEAALHIFSPSGLVIAKGNTVSLTDLLDVLVCGAHGTFKVVKKQPFRFWVWEGSEWEIKDNAGDIFVQMLHQLYRKPVSFSPELLAHVIGSLQFLHTKGSAGNNFLFWVLLMLCDFITAFSAGGLAGTITGKDFILSLLTMRNFEGEAMPPAGDDNRPDNRNHVDGIVGVFVTLIGGILLVKVVVGPELYGDPFAGDAGHAVKMILGYMLGLGLLFGIIGAFIGLAVAQCLAGLLGAPQIDWALLGKTIGKNAVVNVLTFWPTMYGFRENDTSGGTFNPAGTAFRGYPGNGDSPYLLPYEKGNTILCFQGNQGLWSHHAIPASSAQVYAYDFMLDKGVEILASRGGTVVDYFDWCDDNTQTSTPAGPEHDGSQTTSSEANFIIIRHDARVGTHDIGAGGAAVRTYSVYLHGQRNGVRDVFAARGVAPAAIVGQVVAQGQPIMLADSTGNSFCDHVHMQVESGPDTTPPPRHVLRSQLTGLIPFVFKDVNPIIGTNGVPASRAWYASDNPRVP